MSNRTIKKICPSLREDIADLQTHRALPTPHVEHLNPFLFLNHHGPQTYGPRNQGLPFGPHPHRGFETVTVILEGDISHRDSKGHEEVISAGGVQWMTAGSGITHSETSSESFKRSGGPLEILQLWVNLPAKLKMTSPSYRGLQRDEIPHLQVTSEAMMNLISGEWGGRKGAFAPLTDVTLMSIELKENGRLSIPIESERTIFFYIVRGEVKVQGINVSAKNLVEFNRDGDEIEFLACKESSILLGHAPPLNEPIVSYGPFVMNTQQEISETIRDYQEGRFS